jgi:hypothetical protein
MARSLSSESETPLGERRSGIDRRKRASFPPRFSGQRRRSSSGRRKTDRGGYVDIYDARSWGVAIAVFALSLLDAGLTGMHIVDGRSTEANPIMNLAIDRGGLITFFSLKIAMTACPLAILILHKEWLLARYAARLCLWSYILVSLYHLYLVLIVNR